MTTSPSSCPPNLSETLGTMPEETTLLSDFQVQQEDLELNINLLDNSSDPLNGKLNSDLSLYLHDI
jgi:hypothetical protein